MKPATHAIVDHYRCPEDVAHFELAGRPCGDRGYFRFGPETICYGSSCGARSERPSGPLYDALADITTSDGTVRLPFDPSEIIENLRYERYRRSPNGKGSGFRGGAMARSLYYGLRPFLPVSIRKHIHRAYLSGWKDIPFPAVASTTTLGALPVKSSRIMTPAFAQRSVFCRLATRATISPSPFSV